mmetsp:Transcript_18227/g.51283  ORF Transcript_18227/g.51283 Transcript_18227/m.51283 type:complete len:83 (+) Transcript_18227:415-663(+)
MERKVAVLTEVAAAGEAAFKTFKDGVAADGDARTQKEVWTHESDGILSLAKKHYSLHGATWGEGHWFQLHEHVRMLEFEVIP